MISRRRYNQRSRLYFLYFFIVVALVLGIFFREQSAQYVTLFGKPLLTNITSGIRSTVFMSQLFGSKASLIRERDTLQGQVQTLTSEMEARDAAEYFEATSTHDDRIAAAVISRPSFTPYDSLLIDKGSRDEVHEGALVLAHGFQAIGYIKKSYDSLSHVALFTTAGVESLVYVPSPRILARAIGMGGGTIRISVPQGVRIKEGDIVIYPTISRQTIGTISKIVTTPTSPDVYAYVHVDEVPFSLFAVEVTKQHFTPPTLKELEANMADATSTASVFFETPSDFKMPQYATSTNATTTPAL
jgi:cell shape-determining protein MreC